MFMCVTYFAHTYDLYCPPNPSPPKNYFPLLHPLPISLLLPAKQSALCVHIYSYIWVLHMKEGKQYIVFLPITLFFLLPPLRTLPLPLSPFHSMSYT